MDVRVRQIYKQIKQIVSEDTLTPEPGPSMNSLNIRSELKDSVKL